MKMETITNTRQEMFEVANKLKSTHFAEIDYIACCEKIMKGEYTNIMQVEAHPVL